MTYQLTYRSKAKPGLSAEDIEDILESARIYNALARITGCLVFSQGYFLQLLEGEKEIIEDLMDRISRDKRHSHVQVLSQDYINAGVFTKWDMAYLKPNEKIHGTDAREVRETLLRLAATSNKPGIESGSFWHKVKKLLTATGSHSKE